ncbi:hypothetical protein [Bartonella acomydis]|uniref:Uncharacterized protein n=1 Tax=Bartonella acomydis TaxID=686234 RepID=A0ABP9MV35_9HYPH
MSSFGIVGKNPYFNEAIQDNLSEMKNRINRFALFSGYYRSSTHRNELMDKLGHMYANALADQYNLEVLNSIPIATIEELENMASGSMMGENSYFSKELKEGLNKIANDIRKQFKDASRDLSDKKITYITTLWQTNTIMI